MMRLKKSLLWMLLAANVGFVCAAWWANSGALFQTGQAYDALYALGRLAGLLGVLAILLQLTLAGRTKWIERVFGLDRLFVAHGINGLLVLVFIIAHPVLLITSTSMQGGTGWFREGLTYITSSDDLMQAFFAVVLFVGAIAISIAMVKKYFRYEIWYAVHLTMYLAIILAFGHQMSLGGDFSKTTGLGRAITIYWYAIYAFVVANLAYFRFIKPIYDFFVHRFRVVGFVRETASVVSLHISGKNMERFAAQGGQFVIVRFMKKGFWTQAHPFSISKIFSDGSFRVSIKALGDFTQSLDETLVGASVIVDGPHGLFTAEQAHKNDIVLIAGGIGITPMSSLIDDLKRRRKHIALLYANKNANDIPLRGELEKELQSSEGCAVHHIISDDPTWRGMKGRITPDVVAKCAAEPAKCDFFLCGPKPMMNVLRRDLGLLGVPAEQIHYEKFSLG